MNKTQLFEHINYASVISAIVLFLVGVLFAKLTTTGLDKVLPRRLSKSQKRLLKRVMFYAIIALFSMTALQQLGFKLNVLLGAAGILTVAIGFASQTSMGNVISGLFLIFERPFALGDYIKVGNFSGEVFSVDFLSTKIRTSDNTLIRIPNEKLLKTEVVNFSHFSTRRFDMKFGVAYDSDLSEVKQVLLTIASNNKLGLDEPAPLFSVLSYGDSAINIQFSVWTERKNLRVFKNSLQQDVQEQFARQGINIPFPQLRIQCNCPCKKCGHETVSTT